jgi:O-antigen/teichoic acid export membrane protein
MSNYTNSEKRLLTGSAWSLFGKMGAILLGLLSTILMTRLLEPAVFGTYFLVLTIVRVAILVGQIGMNQVVVRYIAVSILSDDRARAGDTIKKASIITGAGSLVVALIYWATDDFLAAKLFDVPVMATVSSFVLLWIVAGSVRILIAECFRGFHDLRGASLLELFVFELLFILTIVAWWVFNDHLSFQNTIVLSAAAASACAILAVYLLRNKIRDFPVANKITFGELFNTGWPLLVSNIVVVVMTQGGIWISGIVSSADDVALYACAFRMAMVIQLPLLVLASVTPQLIAEQHEIGEMGKLESMLRGLASIELLPTTAIYLTFCLFGGFLLDLLFGQFYVGAFWVMILLGSGILFNAWVGYCGPALMMTGNEGTLMKISLFWGVTALIFSYVAGKFYGIYGVAAAIALGNILQHSTMVYMVKKNLGIWTIAGNLAGSFRRIKQIAGC